MSTRPATTAPTSQEAPAMDNSTAELAVVEAELVHLATREEAEQRRGMIRTALEFTVDGLVEAYRQRDYEVLGYGTGAAGWDAYLADSYGDLRFALPAPAREERVVALAGSGLTARAIGAVPGMGGKSTAARDVARLREAGRLEAPTSSTGLDGRTRKAPARKAAPAPARPLTVVDQLVAAAEALEAKGAAGVTTLDLCARLRWRQGPASAAQSRAVKRGLLEWSGAWRDGFAVYRVARPALEG